MFKKILIVGCGLIGSSILRGSINKKISKKIFIYEKSKKNIFKIKKINSKVTILKKLDNKISDIDFVIISTPMNQYEKLRDKDIPIAVECPEEKSAGDKIKIDIPPKDRGSLEVTVPTGVTPGAWFKLDPPNTYLMRFFEFKDLGDWEKHEEYLKGVAAEQYAHGRDETTDAILKDTQGVIDIMGKRLFWKQGEKISML